MAAKKNRRGKPRNDKFSARQRSVESADMKENIPNRFDAAHKDREDYHRGGPNDWRWYAANPQLIKDFASYPFGSPLGGFLNTGNPSEDSNAIPGIMGIYFQPSIGVANGETDPINVAMRRMFALVRRSNSGATNYEAPDLMLYMLAVDSALMYLAFMKRAYAVMLDYTPFNRYYPQALLTAMDLDYEDLQNNLNDFRGYINVYAAKIAQLWIPNSMSYMARHTWMCEGMYTDSTSAKAQTYLYVPTDYYQFAIDGTTKVGKLNLIKFNSGTTPMTFDQMVQFGDDLIAPMITNQDFGIMAGDILKAFGESGIVKVYGITDAYQILPVYNAEVLSQIENSRCFYGRYDQTDVTQATGVGTGYLQCSPIVAQAYPYFDGATGALGNTIAALKSQIGASYILNFHGNEPTPEGVMVSTRLMSRFTNVTGNLVDSTATLQASLDSSGSEVVNKYSMWYYTKDTSGTITLNSTSFGTWNFLPVSKNDTVGKVSEGFMDVLSLMARLANFDWHPPVYYVVTVISGTTASDTTSIAKAFQDIDYYTVINGANIHNMNVTALLSEFSVPMLG